MEIHIKTIPHKDQRYPTVGDYFYDNDGVLQVRISDMGNSLYEFMVAIHEIIEQRLTEQKGITEQEITEFDIMYENEREEGKHTDDEEPGFDPRAPYLDQHTYATSVEMNLCNKFGLNWGEYGKTVMEL